MMYTLYNLAVTLAAPPGALWLRVRPRYHSLLDRFRPEVPAFDASPIWVHACSVGESGTALPMVKAMRDRWPRVPVLMTVSTVAGMEWARSACRDAAVTWFPFDLQSSVRRFVRALHPRALVLIETEFWPNVLRETRRFGAPVVLLNGRLSDKHLNRYRRYRALLRPVVRQISAAGMQNREYADRLIALGADAASVHVTGNTKFDGAVTQIDVDRCARLREEAGFPPDAPVIVFGSTRPGDEALAASCWRELRERYPALRLCVAPRHLDRIDEALAVFDEPVLRRSRVREGQRPAGERVLMLDTVGELAAFYGLASVAVIGGSLYPGVNGHNPLESAALGVPTVFGPYMRNFIDPARELLAYDGAMQVSEPDALLPALIRLLDDANERGAIAARGREAVLKNQGTIARSLDLLETVLAGSSSIAAQ